MLASVPDEDNENSEIESVDDDDEVECVSEPSRAGASQDEGVMEAKTAHAVARQRRPTQQRQRGFFKDKDRHTRK